MARELPLTQGLVAIVDDCDFGRARAVKWYARVKGHTHYATRNNPGPPRYSEQLHRFIMGLERFSEEQVDHIDGDGLNCRRSNLRVVLPVNNSMNKRKPKIGASSRWKGVDRYEGRWRSRISLRGEQYALGMFKSERAAARAYDVAALRMFGAFACLNFPAPGQRSAVSS